MEASLADEEINSPEGEEQVPALFSMTHEGNDWFLSQLLGLFNRLKLEMGISITVGGVLISGTVIDGATYFKEVAKGFASGRSNIPRVNEFFAKFAEDYSTIYDATEEEKADLFSAHPANYIHLKDAKFFTPGGVLPGNQGLLWRGRLAAVEGFTFGVLSASRN
jgi:hypothetical protein